MAPPPLDLVDDLSALGLVPQGAIWHPLKGGQTNRLWQVKGARGPMVVKLFTPGRDTPLFPNDPGQEAMMLRELAPKALAPLLLHQGRVGSGDVLVYTHQSGQAWSHDAQRAATLLRQLHQVPTIPGLRLLPGGSDMVMRQVDRMWSALPRQLQSLLTTLRPQIPVAPIAASDHRLLHGDPVPGNLLMATDADRDMLIDWQCPAMGDPVEDLALFLSPAMQQIYRGQVLTQQEQDDFLSGYATTGSRDAIGKRLGQMAPWHHWRMAAYCGWKAAQGSAVYEGALSLELAPLITGSRAAVR